MVVFDPYVRKLSMAKLEGDAPRRFDGHAPIILPTPLELMEAYIRRLAPDFQIFQQRRGVHNREQRFGSNPKSLGNRFGPIAFPDLPGGPIAEAYDHLLYYTV